MKAVAAFLLVLYLAVSQAWKCSEFPTGHRRHIRQIDAGQGQVVAVAYNHAYLLHGRSWCYMGGTTMKHASVGKAGIWAVGIGKNKNNKVYKMVAGIWAEAKGLRMNQVDAGGYGYVVGANTKAYCVKDAEACQYYGQGRLSSNELKKNLKYISCGKGECWGVARDGKVHMTKVKPDTCTYEPWKVVALLNNKMKMRMIEVSSDGLVIGVTTKGTVYERKGNTWGKISTCMGIRHVTYDLQYLWAVTNSGWLLKCKRSSP